ncbi:MAG: hypothetical protein EA351_12175 [Gemmatimonadales bacterium]|nr:MAG: hypothetical protein EA351_12175 [Gemmatimonadales bacterium]
MTGDSGPQPMSRRRLVELVGELRRRRVFRVVLAYAAAVFLVWQIAEIAFPALGIPDWALALVIVLSALGLPLTVVLGWAFDITREGVVRTGAAHGEIKAPGVIPARPSSPSADARARFARTQRAFEEALRVEPSRRAAALERIAPDPAVRSEVVDLLEAHEGHGMLDELAQSLRVHVRIDGGAPEVGSRFGHYTLHERLGSGGMGVVCRAEDSRLGRMVALKFLSSTLASDPTAKQRFLAEARAAAALDHPNICTILEVGEIDGRLFIAMPYYSGRTVKELLKGGALGAGLAVPIAIEVGRGLAAAHASGVIHRDVKPANVIVTDGGTATIVDFGVAKVARQNLTRTGVALGTVSYMSPEQTQRGAVDHRSDIWALGVMLYEMVSGVRPFRGSTDQAIQDSILTGVPDPLAPHVDGASSLEPVVSRAMQKDPAKRYATAAAMVEALEKVRIGSSPEAGESGLRGGLMRKGERRQVTALTTLLAEFDELVDDHSTEAVEAVLERVRQTVTAVVTSQGGMVHAVNADRIECVFGIPEAREDDTKRAVQAALESTRRCERIHLGPNPESLGIALRSGIDVGIVAVHLDSGDGGKYRIGRSLMKRSARLATEAGPGTVLVSSDCRRMVRSFAETDRGPDVGLGHDSGTISTYHVHNLREFESTLEARSLGGLTAFTGRSSELGVLVEGLEEAIEGSGGIVTVNGEAGIGKSRLLYEFELGVLGNRTRVLHGRCQSYGGAVPYMPFLDVLRQLLKIDEQDPPTATEVTERVEALGGELVAYAPFYLHLLSIPSDTPVPQQLSGDQLRLAIVESIAAILTVASTSRPITLLLEDWHWADEASTAALVQLGELIAAFPMLVIVSHRPGYGVTWESLANHRHITLAPLVADHIHQVVASSLGVDVVNEALVDRIHDRAQGNPFFIEEMCAALAEQGAIEIREGRAGLSREAEALSLPDSVQSVIRTRLDRITPATREVLSAASVVGRDFTRDLVGRALPGAPDLNGALERLRAVGLIQQTRVVPDVAYRFKHALIQEVTYETLLGHQRKELHKRVGEAMEALRLTSDEDRPFARLGDHFLRAEVWDKAVDYALGAARRASRLSQIPDALRALKVAETALVHLPDEEAFERRLEMLLMKERLSETTGERGEQRRIISELRPLVEGCEDLALQAEVLVRAGDLEVSLRNYESAEDTLLEAVDKASRASDSAIHRKALRSLGLLRWHQDRNDEALEILEAVLDDDREAGDKQGMILDHHNLGSVYRGMGEVERALELAEESIRLAEDSPFRKVYAIHTAALCQRELGRTDEGIARWEEGIALCEKHHLPLQQSYLMTSLAHVYLQIGRTEDSVALYEKAVDLTRRVRHAEGVARGVSALAKVLEGLGRHEDALPYWTEASAWFGRMEEIDRQAHAQSRVAIIQEELGEAQQALAAWGDAHQLAGEAGDEPLEFESLMALARLTREHLGSVRLAISYYEHAVRIARETGQLEKAGVALNSLGVVAWESGDYETAHRHYVDAVACFEGTAHTASLGHALSSLGQTLRRLNRLDSARDALERAISLHRESGKAQLEGYALAALGDTLLEQDEPELAVQAFQDSLEIRRGIGDQTGAGWMIQRLATSAHHMGHLDRVRDLVTEATLIADEMGDHDLQEACAKLRP